MYFFTHTSLPDLRLDEVPDINYMQLMDLFSMNLTALDWKKVKKIQLFIDLSNLKSFLKKEPLDPRGTMGEKEIEDALLNQKNLPEFIFDYLDEYESEEEQARYFEKLYSQFFKHQMQKEHGFLKKFFSFEYHLRLTLAAFRVHRFRLDLFEVLQFEDFSDPFVAELIAKKDQATFDFPYGFEELGEKLKDAIDKPKEAHQVVAKFRFETFYEDYMKGTFSLDSLLAYMVLLLAVEDWNALDNEKGNQMLHRIVKDGS